MATPIEIFHATKRSAGLGGETRNAKAMVTAACHPHSIWSVDPSSKMRLAAVRSAGSGCLDPLPHGGNPMARHSLQERALQDRILACARCDALKVSATLGDEFGVLVWRRGIPVGLWSWFKDAYIYRNLSGWQVLHSAPDIEQALDLTIALSTRKS